MHIPLVIKHIIDSLPKTKPEEGIGAVTNYQEMELSDIRNCNVQKPVAVEVLRQSELRLKDLLDIQQGLERKSIAFFNLYFAAGGFIVTSLNEHFLQSPVFFIIFSISILMGIICFVLSIKPRTYGVLGALPSDWLRKDVLEATEQNLAVFITYYCYFYQTRINVSEKSNGTKSKLIFTGLVCGVIAIASLIAPLIIRLF